MVNIDEMPAGRETDALVAEKVMGRVPCDKWTPTLHPETGWLKNCQCQACYPAGDPAYYSTDIAAAWQVVERMITGTVWECCLAHQFDGWDCLFSAPDKSDAHGVGESAPFAICRAALKLMEDKEEVTEVDCQHEFFKCQVPAGDSCVAIYHQVCKKCRWDKRKGVYMPLDIWRGWALPQLEELGEEDK